MNNNTGICFISAIASKTQETFLQSCILHINVSEITHNEEQYVSFDQLLFKYGETSAKSLDMILHTI